MGNLIWRLFIILVIFISGLLVGNIFTPKQILEEKDIVAIPKAKTSLDLDKEEDLSALQQSQDIQVVFSALVRQTYQTTKREYEYQLQNLNKNHDSQKEFIKAQKNYLSIIGFIEQNYPLQEEETTKVAEQNSKKETFQEPEQEQKTPENINQPQIPQNITKEETSQNTL